MTERNERSDSGEATRAVRALLRDLSDAASTNGAAEQPRLFFPDGIDYINITATIGGVTLGFQVAGPKSKPLTAANLMVADARLHALEATGFVQLPQDSLDYRRYSDPTRQYGTQAAIDTIARVGAAVHAVDPNLTFSVGDISFADGSDMPPHAAHKMGRNIDIRPICTDRVDRPTNYHDAAHYDQAATQQVITAFLADANVSYVIFNDPAVDDPAGTGRVHRDAAGVHDNHVHVQTVA